MSMNHEQLKRVCRLKKIYYVEMAIFCLCGEIIETKPLSGYISVEDLLSFECTVQNCPFFKEG